MDRSSSPVPIVKRKAGTVFPVTSTPIKKHKPNLEDSCSTAWSPGSSCQTPLTNSQSVANLDKSSDSGWSVPDQSSESFLHSSSIDSGWSVPSESLDLSTTTLVALSAHSAQSLEHTIDQPSSQALPACSPVCGIDDNAYHPNVQDLACSPHDSMMTTQVSSTSSVSICSQDAMLPAEFSVLSPGSVDSHETSSSSSSSSAVTDFVFSDKVRDVPCIRSNFHLLSTIGQGTFGVVVLASGKGNTPQMFALKYLVPIVKQNHIISEIKALQVLGKHINTIELLSVVRHKDQIVLIFPHFEHIKFRDLLKSTSSIDVVKYMHNLLHGLEYIHSKGIIHRDIKPNNFLYNREHGIGKIIDFGLSSQTKVCCDKNPKTFKLVRRPRSSQCPHPPSSVCDVCMSRRKKCVSRPGTPGYRAPEVLMGYSHQSYPVDIWSSGVILLSLLSGKYPYFQAKSDMLALMELFSTFGYTECVLAANELGISLVSSENTPKRSLIDVCQKFKDTCDSVIFNTLINFLEKMLTLNPNNRLSATSALTSKLFIC